MSNYIRNIDYLLHIQDRDFNQLISANPLVQKQAEQWAIDKVRSVLVQRWDCDEEFKDTHVWSPLSTYTADDLVYLDASAFVAGAYAASSLVLYTDGKIYIRTATTAGYTTQAPGNTTYWTELGTRYDLFNVIVKQEWYDSLTYYSIGNQVFYKGYYYTAIQSGKGVLPNDKVNGASYWGTKTSAAITTGILPTNTTHFAEGDNRSSQIFNIVIDLAIYKIQYRLAQQKITIARANANTEALNQLNDFMHGNATLENFPVKQAVQGLRTMITSNEKNINTY